jgi:hypothetical protein
MGTFFVATEAQGHRGKHVNIYVKLNQLTNGSQDSMKYYNTLNSRTGLTIRPLFAWSRG